MKWPPLSPRSLRHRRAGALFALLILALVLPASGLMADKPLPDGPRLSPMGAIASGQAPLPDWARGGDRPSPLSLAGAPGPFLSPGLPAPGEVNATPGGPRFQSETSIAARGDTVVVGFNDADGFSNPAGTSVSGYSYSHDGGQTFTYGGQLPVPGNGDAVYGDPDVKVWVDPATDQAVFVYSSLFIIAAGNSSLSVHVSTDGGVTWSLPREAVPITNEIGFADKEFLSLDPETGRLVLSWTSFATTTTMQAITSDDLGLTWSAVDTISARPEDGQGSCPRFDPTSDRAYVVWWAFGSPNTISMVRSSDNGDTWSAPVDIVSGVVPPLPPFGSDRINGYPSLSVSPTDGSLHLIYSSKQTADFGDVWYTSSADSGDTWTTPVTLNANPGHDRSQFFAWGNVGPDGGIDVTWLDQRIGDEGSDLTETMHTHSEDGGATWSCPASLTSQPWHAEYGNDTGQPNIGDYNQVTSVMDGGSRRVHISYARTDEADRNTDAPDTYVATRTIGVPQVGVGIGPTTVADIGCTDDGVLVAGEGGELTLMLFNGCLGSLTNLSGALTTTTPGVTLLNPGSPFADITPWDTGVNTGTLRLNLADTFPCGDPVELRLAGTSDQGDFVADISLPTGVVVEDSLLLAEDFEGVASGLPSFWNHSQPRGVSNPWQVSGTYASSGSQSVFCANYPDTSLSRLTSPPMAVPVNADLVEVTFNVTYDIEEVGNGRQGWDGALLKIEVDSGTTYLAGSFSTLFEGQYRTQIVRGSGNTSNPLSDLSAWSGNTLPGFESIRIQYPGLGGHILRLIFEMGSDSNTGGTGIFVDDIEVRALDLDCGSCTSVTGVDDGARRPASLVVGNLSPNPLRASGSLLFSLPTAEPVWAEIYDLAGRRVRALHGGETLAAGEHTLVWDGRDQRGVDVVSGIYFLQVRTATEAHTNRAVVMR